MNLIVNRILPPTADSSDPTVRSQVGQRCGILGIAAMRFCLPPSL